MFHQVLLIGEGSMPVAIEYGIDDDCGVLYVESIKDGEFELIKHLEPSQIKNIEHQLWKRHDSVVREMDWLHGESVAAERAEFREACA